MDVHVLERIWKDGYYCFIPTIKGWTKDPKTGKLKAEKYFESIKLFKDDVIKILNERDPLGSRADCYFCPVQFTNIRQKEYAEPTLNILWADLDEADPRTMHPRPTIAWHSSEYHYQAIWVLTEHLPTEEIEALNKAMSYHVGADKSGWDLTQLLRVPGSYNFKYGEPQECTLLWDDGPEYDAYSLRHTLKVTSKIDTCTEDPKPHIDKLIEGWRLTRRTTDLLNAKDAPVGERSDRLWELEKLLVEAGMPVALIVDIIKLTVWNKFADRKDGDKQLLTETLKAEKEFRLGKVIEIVEPIPLPGLLTFDKFMEQDITDPEFMVQDFLLANSVGMCAGEPKTMKSTLMLDMALSVASGKPFLGIYPVKPAPVLYIQEENSEADIKRRFMRIAHSRRVLIHTSMGYEPMPIPLYIVNNHGINLQDKEYRDWLDNIIKIQSIKLLILDPWYMLCGHIDENNAKEVTPILKYLTTIRNRFGCAVILVHHFKKGETTRGGQRMRGSSVFHSWIECGLYANLNKGKSGNVIMEREFRSEVSDKGLNLIFSSEKGSLLSYDVQVHDITLTKHVDEADEETDKEVTELTGAEDSSEFSKTLMLDFIKAGTFTRIKCKDTYGVSDVTINRYLTTLVGTGKIILTVAPRSIKGCKHITVIKEEI